MGSLLHAEDARWLRYAAISPQGDRIAFGYRGDLWVVAADGGEARPLTGHVGYERSPVWSPDGRQVAFASDRHGNFDVFVVASRGGKARRLTVHSTFDVPTCFSRDSKRVFFSSRRVDAPQAVIGSVFLPELYSIPIEGGRPRMELTTPALNARLSPDGTSLAYEDIKAYESGWRKHHVSAHARDIWIVERRTGKHTRLTPFRGEDRDPVWARDGKTLYYLSERSGSLNVWRSGGEPAQVTHHGPHPVRFLSIADDGTLSYTYNGDLLVKRPGQEPRKLRVTVAAGARTNASRTEVSRKGATGFAVAPSEDEVAFVVRGEVFVASTEHGTTKRVTFTPSQERSVAWAPDGRTLYYAAERDGSWSLYQTSLKRKQEERFFNATVLEEKPLLVGPDEAFQPVVSPDGKQIAYLHNRDEIRLLDVATGKTRTLVPAERNYSYADGDISYSWSPDSRWLACTVLLDGQWIEDIGVVNIGSGELVHLLLSGYYDAGPRWSRDSRTLYFYSNRLGRRSHGGWGSDGDVFALDLTQAAQDRARLSEEEFALLEKKEKKERRKKRKGKKKGKGKDKGGDEENGENGGEDEDDDDDDDDDDDEKKEKVEPVRIEFEGREDRVRRLTLHSAPLGGFALSPDGETLVYWARVEDKWDLWVNKVRESATKKLFKANGGGRGEVHFAKEGDAVFIRSNDGRIARVNVKSGKAEPVKYAAEMTIDTPEERAYIFEHVWRQLKRKFYDPGLHGVDWDALKVNYLAFLGHIDTNHDFAELLSEMLGELNASHTGARYRIPQEGADETASLGLLFDPEHAGDGLKIAEVLRGGPCARAESRIAPGAVLTHIDGVKLTPAVNHFALLNRKANKPTLLGFGPDHEEVVKPIPRRQEYALLYRRWVRKRREETDRLSGGRLGYVHVRSMGEGSFRKVYEEVLGRHGAKEGLVVDTRFNGGGNLHDDLVAFLGAKQYLTPQPRGKKRGTMGGAPWNRWTRPVIVIQNEGNYSDAHIFPYIFKELGLGKLVGTPVAGTGTAVWWERQIDRTLMFGIPQVGYVMPDGKYLENTELAPDVLVVNDPESRARGRDPQLERAVKVLLEELK
ncbi:MAG: S41 family peptidase [Planctomycetota bacterium]